MRTKCACAFYVALPALLLLVKQPAGWAQYEYQYEYVDMTLGEEQMVAPPLDPVPAAAPVPDPEPSLGPAPVAVAAPAPEDNPDWNDQGVYDKRLNYFSVYMGTIGYDAWTHHGAYKKVAQAWYSVLTSKSVVLSWLYTRPVDGFEIRYKNDSIPAPLRYSGRAVVRTSAGVPMAEVFALAGQDLDFRLAELTRLLGRRVLLTNCRLSVTDSNSK